MTYVFVEKQEKYQYCLVVKSALSETMYHVSSKIPECPYLEFPKTVNSSLRKYVNSFELLCNFDRRLHIFL